MSNNQKRDYEGDLMIWPFRKKTTEGELRADINALLNLGREEAQIERLSQDARLALQRVLDKRIQLTPDQIRRLRDAIKLLEKDLRGAESAIKTLSFAVK